MGGRGAKTSAGRLRKLINAYNRNGGGSGTPTGQYDSEITVADFQTVGDYTDNNNPALLKWQSQTDDKSANFLAKVDRDTDLAQIQADTNDPWAFYDNPQQKFVETIGLNAPTTVLSEKDFNKYVAQTGATELYRGWSGDNAVDRFKNSPNSHIGNGINGDGYYFAPDLGTAQGYGPVVTRAALSPSARVASLDAVNAAIGSSSPKYQRSLSIAGSSGTRTFGPNEGQAQKALQMGFNCIDAGWAIIPLTRDAVVICDKTI